MKPKGTRLQSNVGKTLDEDPMLAREILDLDAEMHQMEPVVYSPTFIEARFADVRTRTNSVSDCKRASRRVRTNRLLLVEGSSDLATGSIATSQTSIRGVARRPCAVSHRLRHAQ